MVLKTREEQKKSDLWDLTPIFPNIAAWDAEFAAVEPDMRIISTFQNTLHRSAEQLATCLNTLMEIEQRVERLGIYAFLQYQGDSTNSEHQRIEGQMNQLEGQLRSISSYIAPEIQAIDSDSMTSFLASPCLQEYTIMLNKLLRQKPHILSLPEEKILAEESTLRSSTNQAFAALTDADMEFGSLELNGTETPLTQASYAKFMMCPDRETRRKAYLQYYGEFDKHKHTLATLHAASVNQDCTLARIRKHNSARGATLFSDKVPESVYDNLISVVHNYLPHLHRYYKLRAAILGVQDFRHYDAYVPLVADVKTHYPYEQGVETVIKALAPLGAEYTEALQKGLLGGWVDRYENKGKRSGAFSAGTYNAAPYILLNYNQDVLASLFTLAHEAGHSMHSWYSVKNNPFQHYNYTIFEAEVASTFNEKLLGHYLMQEADSLGGSGVASKQGANDMKKYLINKELDSFVATLFRQTMFAEFEHKTHALQEQRQTLTLDVLRSTYRELLEAYFGPAAVFEEVSDLEGLRIPHFYSAFYVYKYATGLSASVALSQKVLNGDKTDLEAYMGFLNSGGSKYPLESLKAAGVDMESTAPTEAAMKRFVQLLDEFERLL